MSRLISHRRSRWLAALALPALLAFTALFTFAAGSPPARQEVHVAIKGLACPLCARRLASELSALPGTETAKVTSNEKEAVLDLAPGATLTNQRIAKTIRDAGFVAGPIVRKTLAAKTAAPSHASGRQ